MNGSPPIRLGPTPIAGFASTSPSSRLACAPARRPHRLLIGSVSLGLAATTGLVAPLPSAEAASVCAQMTAPVYYRVNPKSTASLLTPSKTESDNAGSKYGFTSSQGALFRASTRSASGLGAVHRLYKNGDFFWAANAAEVTAAKKAGYADQGVNFFAADKSADGCAVKVLRWVRNGKHQVSVSASGESALRAAGWKSEGAPFYAASAATSSYSTPPLTGTGASNTDGVFTIAVLPDTQQEVFGSDTRFANRNKWLVANRKRLDLRYETQVGDLVNWDTPSHDQYAHASSAMKVSEAAGLPWSPTIGNHDAAATCVGGSACPRTNVRLTVRDTHTFNSYFPPTRFRAMRGTFERGKVDNSYSEFSAEGATWMVMNLELWPRTAVLDWANKVIKAHPKDNVIVVTHAYLEANGAISTRRDYGDNSPKTIYDRVIKPNANVKLVMSGHVGAANSRVDARTNNPVASYLQTFHDIRNNPTRLITINTKKGSVRGQVYYQKTNTYLAGADKTYTGMKWVR